MASVKLKGLVDGLTELLEIAAAAEDLKSIQAAAAEARSRQDAADRAANDIKLEAERIRAVAAKDVEDGMAQARAEVERMKAEAEKALADARVEATKLKDKAKEALNAAKTKAAEIEGDARDVVGGLILRRDDLAKEVGDLEARIERAKSKMAELLGAV